jgi:ABC-type transport system involved in multi-copper enzyme maturation permease subunit
MNEGHSDAYVRKFSFRAFEGTRKGRIYRLWATSWQWWTHQWERSRAVKILLGFLIFILVMTNLFLLSFKDFMLNTINPQTGEQITTNDLLEDNLLALVRGVVTFQTTFSSESSGGGEMMMSIGGLSIFFLILVALVGSGLIADDISNQTTEIYYSKLERHEYILGKFGAFFLFGNIVIVLPFVLEFFLLVAGLGEISLIQAFPVLIQSILITEIMVLTFASIVLGFSALTSRRLYAGLTAFMFLFVMNMIIPSLAFSGGEVGFQILFDVLTLLLLTSFIITGTTEVIYYPHGETADISYVIDLANGSGIESWMVIGALAMYILGGFAIVVYQVYRRHAR